ncbi:MAG: DUF559 domain-containing protein [Ignavibacteriae bacterium]|nr:DUF559 domain-containing protein [Ignavibacteriota bacterium]
MKKKNDRTVLVALVKSPRDLKIALEKHWYRVPVKSAPPILRDLSVRYIAFYQNRSFGEESYQIRWYGEVTHIEIMKRRQLLPAEKLHPNADEPYLKIEVANLKTLPRPIISGRKRPIVFIPTTTTKLLHATEINDLYSDSPLEDKLWNVLKTQEISAERQYFVGRQPHLFALDFALFCKKQNLDIECNGDIYHGDVVRMRKDRKRNNTLASLGWQVLRFGKDDIIRRQTETINTIKRTVNEAGGIEVAEAPGVYKVLPLETGSLEADLFTKQSPE